jgi:hypothetical protein
MPKRDAVLSNTEVRRNARLTITVLWQYHNHTHVQLRTAPKRGMRKSKPTRMKLSFRGYGCIQSFLKERTQADLEHFAAKASYIRTSSHMPSKTQR